MNIADGCDLLKPILEGLNTTECARADSLKQLGVAARIAARVFVKEGLIGSRAKAWAGSPKILLSKGFGQCS